MDILAHRSGSCPVEKVEKFASFRFLESVSSDLFCWYAELGYSEVCSFAVYLVSVANGYPKWLRYAHP